MLCLKLSISNSMTYSLIPLTVENACVHFAIIGDLDFGQY